MREIKFDLIYKGEHRFHHKKYYLCELMRGIDKICDIHHMMDLIAKRQYTGLKDKNGVEIYEGDIVKGSLKSVTGKHFGEYVGKVIFSEFEWAVETGDGSFPVASWVIVQYVEVIGNTYETPELLEQQ